MDIIDERYWIEHERMKMVGLLAEDRAVEVKHRIMSVGLHAILEIWIKTADEMLAWNEPISWAEYKAVCDERCGPI